MAWFGVNGAPIDWHQTFHSLTCVLSPTGLKSEDARHVLVFMHSGGQPQEFKIPKTVTALNWRLVVDTAAESPNDAFAESVGPPLDTGAPVMLDHHALKCYIEA